MESLNYYFIFGAIAVAIFIVVIYLLIKYCKTMTIRDFKRLVAENNICNEGMIFIMLDRMSFEEMNILSNEIKTFLKNNFIKNLSVYKEGLKLIVVRIALPEKQEKIIEILNEIIYKKTRIIFLTPTGFTTAKQFKAEELISELNFLQTPGLKKEFYIN